MQQIMISDRPVGVGQPCFIIAEVAQAHDGSLGTAHAFIDAVAQTGVDAIKFQTHIASAESTPAEPWRVKFSPQDETRFDYWRRMEFGEEQWLELRRHADRNDLMFLSSAFSVEAVDMLQRIGMPAWKVASGELDNPIFLDRIAQTGLPALLSSGMSSLEELDRAVALFRKHDVPLAVFQCTTAYPCPPEKVGLEMIGELRDRYDCPVGLSDHSGTIYPGLAAATLGANLLEVHVTLSREMFGPDVCASVTTAELKQLVDGVRFIEKSLAAPLDKDSLADEMAPLRKTFGKSVVFRVDLPEGTVLGRHHLTVKKPGTGLPASRFESLLGHRLTEDVRADQQISEEIISNES